MPPTPPTDAELDALIRRGLQLIGIDLGQLPVSDPAAPADQTRVMSSLRNFLRSTPPVISDYSPSVQDHPPVVYPAPFSAWTRSSSAVDTRPPAVPRLAAASAVAAGSMLAVRGARAPRLRSRRPLPATSTT